MEKEKLAFIDLILIMLKTTALSCIFVIATRFIFVVFGLLSITATSNLQFKPLHKNMTEHLKFKSIQISALFDFVKLTNTWTTKEFRIRNYMK